VRRTAPFALFRLAVLARMMLAGFLGVVFGLNVVALRHMGMMTGSFVVTCFVMLGSGAMVLGGLFVMLSCFMMMFCCFF
jgi:hypothetical protein